MLVCFTPPAGHPPLELEGLGRVRIFYPRDQAWKKVKERHKIKALRDPMMPTEYLKDPETKEVVYVWGERKKWVVDEEKTALLKAGKIPAPPEAHEISEDEYRLLSAMPKARNLFKKHSDVEKAATKSLNDVMREADKKKAELEAKLAEKERELREKIETIDKQLADFTRKQEQTSEVERKLGRK